MSFFMGGNGNDGALSFSRLSFGVSTFFCGETNETHNTDIMKASKKHQISQFFIEHCKSDSLTTNQTPNPKL